MKDAKKLYERCGDTITFELRIPVDVEMAIARKVDLEDYLKTQATLQIQELLGKRRKNEN